MSLNLTAKTRFTAQKKDSAAKKLLRTLAYRDAERTREEAQLAAFRLGLMPR